MDNMRIGDIATFINGYAFKPSDRSKDGKKIIRIQNLTQSSKDINYTSKLVDDKFIIRKGDILISWSATLDVFEWEEEEAYLNQHIFKVKFDKVEIDKDYFKYMIRFALKMAENSAHGSTMKHLTKKTFESIEIPFPSLKLQTYIAKLLNKSVYLVNRRQQQLQELEELQKSQFNKMININYQSKWDKVRLKDIATVRSSKRVFKNELVDSGIPFFRGNEIKSLSEGKEISSELFITQEHYEKLKKDTDIPSVGDILLPSICPNGEIWRVNSKSDFYFKDGRVLWIKFDDLSSNNTYLHHAIKNQIIKDYSKIASGTTFSELKIFTLKELEIVIPPFEIQDEYAYFVERIEVQKQKMQESLELMEVNFAALMQKAFRGELVPEELVTVK